MKSEMMIKKTILFGVLATVITTVVSHFFGMIHLPRTDFHGLISTVLSAGVVESWLAYFVAGVAVAHIYRSHFHDRLPDGWLRKGLLFGFVMFLILQAVIYPILGLGMMTMPTIGLVSMYGSLAIYGMCVSYLYELRS